MMTKMEIKDTHSKDLRNLRKWIREELDLRAEVEREIESSKVSIGKVYSDGRGGVYEVRD